MLTTQGSEVAEARQQNAQHSIFIKQSVLTQYVDEPNNTTTQTQQYTAKQINEFMVESVQNFIEIFKTALFKFYRIKSYMRSQEDMFIQLITKRVLNSEVSNVLVKAAKALHKDETKLFQ